VSPPGKDKKQGKGGAKRAVKDGNTKQAELICWNESSTLRPGDADSGAIPFPVPGPDHLSQDVMKTGFKAEAQ
jgi:hypothetical protein